MSPPHLRRAYHPPSPCSIVASGALRWILTEGAIDEPRAAIEIRPAPGAGKCRVSGEQYLGVPAGRSVSHMSGEP